MKTRIDRDITHLQVIFSVIGVLFLASTICFLIANWAKLPELFTHFGSSLENIITCLAPFLTGFAALLFLVPMLLSIMVDKLSAKMFEFLVFVCRFTMYVVIAPLTAVVAVFALFIAIVDPSYLLPVSTNLQDMAGYIFYMLFFVEVVMLLVAYHRSHKISIKR